VRKKAFLVALASVLGLLLAPAASALAAPGGASPGSSPPAPVVSLGGGSRVTLNPSLAHCHSAQSAPGETRQCSITQRLPLSDLPAAARAERAAAMQNRAAKAAKTAKTGSPDAAAAITEPAQCDFTDVEAFTKSATANPDRFTSCSDTVIGVQNYEITSTPPFIEPLGFFFWEDQQWESYSASSGSWTHGMVVLGYILGADGDLASGVTADLESSCDIFAGICSATSTGIPDPQPVTIAPGSTTSYEWAESDAGASSTTARTDNILDPDLGVFWEDISTLMPLEVSDVGALDGRCDTLVTTRDGCVNEDFTPTVTYSAVTHPLVQAVAQHIYNAQRTLTTAWGVPASAAANGAVLNRDTSPADIAANNRAACRGVRIRPGQQCDEFPLASTFQGAAFQPVFSAVAVPAASNRSQGGITSTFYTGNRVIDDDAFYVLAILRNGSASW
jgi:hypothetical protein